MNTIILGCMLFGEEQGADNKVTITEVSGVIKVNDDNFDDTVDEIYERPDFDSLIVLEEYQESDITWLDDSKEKFNILNK